MIRTENMEIERQDRVKFPVIVLYKKIPASIAGRPEHESYLRFSIQEAKEAIEKLQESIFVLESKQNV